MGEQNWNVEKNLPLRDIVFRRIRRAILRGELAPGQRLMEMKLADKMGVSRTPVREAIQMLEKDGLVVTVPHRGAVVADIRDKDLREVLEVREALEVLAVRLACRRMSEEGFERLEAAEQAFEKAIGRAEVDLIEMAEADEGFHHVIYEGAQNDKLLLLAHNMREQMYRFRIEHLKTPESREQLASDHRHIAENLRKRDPDGAAERIVAHLRSQQELVHAHIEKKQNEIGG